MSNGTRILTVPRHNPVNAFTLGGIVRDAGLTVEQFGIFCSGADRPSHLFRLLNSNGNAFQNDSASNRCG